MRRMLVRRCPQQRSTRTAGERPRNASSQLIPLPPRALLAFSGFSSPLSSPLACVIAHNARLIAINPSSTSRLRVPDICGGLLNAIALLRMFWALSTSSGRRTDPRIFSSTVDMPPRERYNKTLLNKIDLEIQFS